MDQKYLERYEIWYRRKMEKICWNNPVKYEEVLDRIKAGKKHLTFNKI
jgi:hypothetical protein